MDQVTVGRAMLLAIGADGKSDHYHIFYAIVHVYRKI